MSKIHKIELNTNELALVKAALNVFSIQMSQGSVDPRLTPDDQRGCAEHRNESQALLKKLRGV